MQPQALPPVLPPPARTWWQRNGKWAIPLACVGAVALLAGVFALFFSLLLGFMKSSGAYQEAFARAAADPAVIRALGSPVKAGLFFSGHIEVNGPSGRAELAIPLSGPKGKGTLYVEAVKSAGEWHFPVLVVQLSGTGERIDLREKTPKPPSSAGAPYF